MTRQEHLLTILSEECAEVAQRVSKALRFGLKEVEPGQKYTNAARISQELFDLRAVAEMLEKCGALESVRYSTVLRLVEKKKAKVPKYLAYSSQCGTLAEKVES